MFGISMTELLVIFIVILIVFGPDKLPELATQLGRFFREFSKISNATKREFYSAVYNPTQENKNVFARELQSVQDEIKAIGQQIKPTAENTPSENATEKSNKGQNSSENV